MRILRGLVGALLVALGGCSDSGSGRSGHGAGDAGTGGATSGSGAATGGADTGGSASTGTGGAGTSGGAGPGSGDAGAEDAGDASAGGGQSADAAADATGGEGGPVGPPCSPPVCAGGNCFELCTTGWPCDEGCCDTAPTEFYGDSDYGSGTLDFLDLDVDRLGRGLATLGNGDTEGFHDRSSVNGRPWTLLGTTEDDPSSLIVSTQDFSPARQGAIAASPASDDEVHVVYGLNEPQPSRFRHGTRTASGWTFEAAPFPGVLVVDHAGIPMLLGGVGGREVARRTAASWQTEALPFGAVNLSIDDDGVAYAGGPNGFARRTAQGIWSVVNSVDLKPEVVEVRFGTFFGATIDTDGNLKFASQRPGGPVVEMTVAGPSDGLTLSHRSMAIDACGWPHFFASVLESETAEPGLYIRWTRQGFRGKLFPAGFYCITSGVAIAVGGSRAYFGRSSCGPSIWSLPLSGG